MKYVINEGRNSSKVIENVDSIDTGTEWVVFRNPQREAVLILKAAEVHSIERMPA